MSIQVQWQDVSFISSAKFLQSQSYNSQLKYINYISLKIKPLEFHKNLV